MQQKKMEFVFWDLETTGLGTQSRIVSVAWITQRGSEKEWLVMPSVPIELDASRVHGLTKDTLRQAGALPIETQLAACMRALRDLAVPICLCAHNGKAFDTHVLRAELERANLALPPNVVGFADSMLWARSTLGIRPTGMDALNLMLFGQGERDTHSALEDARILRRIVQRLIELHPTARPMVFETVEQWRQRTHKTCLPVIASHLERVVAGLPLTPAAS